MIGAGRVGSALGAALARAGHEVVAASGVSEQSRQRAERFLPGVELMPADEVLALADFVLLAVPDDVLRPLVVGLAETGAWRPGSSPRTRPARRASACWTPPPPAGCWPSPCIP